MGIRGEGRRMSGQVFLVDAEVKSCYKLESKQLPKQKLNKDKLTS